MIMAANPGCQYARNARHVEDHVCVRFISAAFCSVPDGDDTRAADVEDGAFRRTEEIPGERQRAAGGPVRSVR